MPDPFGNLANSIASLFDTAPKVPQAPKVNLEEQQRNAITANANNFGAASNLAGKVNDFNYDQLHAMLQKAIPGYDELIKSQGVDIASMLKGEIPQDVQDQIQRNSAVKSLYGGYGGTGMGRNLVARDLGLTSLQITDKALDSASRWMASTKALSVPGQFNVASMFVTPAQMAENEWSNQTSQFQRDWTNNIVTTEEGNRMNHAWANVGSDVVKLAMAAYGAASSGGGGSSFGSAEGNSAAGAEGEAIDTYGGGSGGGGGGFNWQSMMKYFNQ